MELLQMESNRLDRYRDARLDVNYATRTVAMDRATIHLTRMEFELLSMLTRRAGEVVPKDTLLMTIWGYGPDIQSRTLNVHLRRLRVKLGTYSKQHLETVFGLGYRLQPCYAPAELSQAAGA
ncbi:MAG TPA: winged helix-turn-helix domain-containing protein [Bryobacteraceae bacterium]|nr:winged helix-turn-helix domain-containing protein [Bryobacteraceae bacterium]